jgi:hypothetical protein
VRKRIASHDGDRRLLASAHARRRKNPHAGAEPVLQGVDQLAGARKLARERVADAHGERRRGRGAVFQHVEVMIERRDFVDLGGRQVHLARERDDVLGGEMAVAVLDFVQMLEEQIAPPRRIAQQRLYLCERRRFDGTTLQLAGAALASALYVTAFQNTSSRTT